jgi:hypothetical protein
VVIPGKTSYTTAKHALIEITKTNASRHKIPFAFHTMI